MFQGREQGRPWQGETGISGMEKVHTQNEESAAIPVSSPWMGPETNAETNGNSGDRAGAGIHGVRTSPCATRDLTLWPGMAQNTRHDRVVTVRRCIGVLNADGVALS